MLAVARGREQSQDVGGGSLAVARIGLGPAAQQQLDGGGVAVLRSQHERGSAILVDGLDVGAVVQKRFDLSIAPALRGLEEIGRKIFALGEQGRGAQQNRREKSHILHTTPRQRRAADCFRHRATAGAADRSLTVVAPNGTVHRGRRCFATPLARGAMAAAGESAWLTL